MSINILLCAMSVMGGQWKQLDLETQEAVSLATKRQKLELGDLCEHQVKILATGPNDNLLDRIQKSGHNGHLHVVVSR